MAQGWIESRVGEVFQIIGGGTPSTQVQEYWDGMIPWITSADILENHSIMPKRFISQLGVNDSATNIVPANTLIVVTRVSLGKIGITEKPLCFSQDCQALINLYDLNCKFALYQLSVGVKGFLWSSRGTTINGVTKKQLADTKFLIAPLPEQHRIVAKIEELFSELDKSVENLRTAQQQLKVYRQAVLKWAFEGKLTEEWRTNQKKFTPTEDLVGYIRQEHSKEFQRLGKKSKMIQPLLPEVLITLPTIPAEWSWLKINDITTGVEYGTSSKSSEVGTVPVIRMGNIQNSKIVWDDLVFTSDETEIGKYKLQKDDVLFNRTNSPELVGKTAIFLGERTAIFAGYLIRLNHIKTVIHAKYLNYYLNSFVAKSYGNSVKTDGVNQSNINGEKLINYPLPICSIEEQHQIVLAIESRLSVCDKLEETISHSLKQAEALRQSILQQAFAGKLVPQDPQDEPAAALLARIRSDREATAPAKKAKATKGRKK